jgi:hypothetical protein
MKSKCYLIFILLCLNSCNYFKSNESKILDATRKYTEDYYFINNFKTEIIEFKLKSYEEVNADITNSLIKEFVQNQLLKVAIKLSNQTAEEFFNMDGMLQGNFIDKAGKTDEFKTYAQDLKKSLGQKGYKVSVFSKYISMDINGNNKSNHLYDDRIYLLNENLEVLGIIK